MSIVTFIKKTDHWRLCVMILVEIVVFGVVYALFSQNEYNGDSFEIDRAQFNRELTYEVLNPNFANLEFIAGLAFLAVMWFAWRVYHKDYTLGAVFLKSIVWILIVGCSIYICADSLGSKGIVNFVVGGAVWDARPCYLSPFTVVWCGFGYALPIWVAAMFCRFIYEKKIQEYTYCTPDGVIIPHINSRAKKIAYSVLICMVMYVAVQMAFVVNMVFYLIEFFNAPLAVH